MNIKNLMITLLILFSFSCKEEKKNDVTENKITIYEVKDIALAGGTIQRINDFPSKFIQPRNVDVWLPSTYSKDKQYAILYMHDGQMLFDATTTWNKQEWMVDEVASRLMDANITKDFIVVGTYNISDIRWQDLFPQKAMDYMDKTIKDSLFADAKEKNFNINFKGDDYLKFLVEELKPFIEKNYSTYPDRENTFVAGSSLGGLMSMYAISEYPEVFGAAACISTHWVGANPTLNNPYPEAIFKYMEANLPSPKTHRLYFDYGTKTLDQYYPQYTSRVDSIFKSKGYSETNYRNLKFEGADHSENSWNQRLDIPLTFLLGKSNE